jgi:hypothetical protein
MGTNRRRLTRPERTIGLCGLALYALSLVPRWGWLTTPSARLGDIGRLPGTTGNFNAYFGYGWPLELAIALGVGVSVIVLGRKLVALQPPRFVYLLSGVLITVLVMIALTQGPTETGFENVRGVEVGRGPLLGVALIPSLLILLAGVGFARGRQRAGGRR